MNLINCQRYIHRALLSQAPRRVSNPNWIEDERMAVTLAANEWAVTHGTGHAITVEGVERVEQFAVGHVDYGEKLSLYAAELAVFGKVEREARQR